MAEIDHFENEIIQEAKEEAKTIIQRAEQEANKILEQAKIETERISQANLIKIKLEEERKAQRELSRLRIKNKIELNNVKERLLGEVIAGSFKQIQEWKDKKSDLYRSALTNQIIQGGVSLEGGELNVLLTKDDIALIDIKQLESEIFKKCDNKTIIKVSTSEKNDVESGSIISKGPLTVHNTIQAKFDRREDIIRNKLHDILFS